jgi:hypothetical protein
MITDNRLYDRIYLPDEKSIPCEGLGFAFEGQISVVGLGGMYVRTGKSYPIGTVLPLRFSAGAEVVEADCIVRDVEPEGIGLEFVKLRGPNEDSLKRILNAFRAA